MQKRFVFNNTQDWRRPAEEFGACHVQWQMIQNMWENVPCNDPCKIPCNDPKHVRKCTLQWQMIQNLWENVPSMWI